MKELRTALTIPAATSEVWNVLVDLHAFAEWNPFIVAAAGDVEVGARLMLRMQPPGGRAMTFRPRVTVAEPSRTLEWLGHLGLPGIFDGRHRFELQPHADGTRVVQSETFTGVAVPLLWRTLEDSTRTGFEALNAGLRSRVMARAAAPS